MLNRVSPALHDTLVAKMKAGFDQLTNILLEEKAQTSRKRPVISDSDEMSDSEEINQAKQRAPALAVLL